MRWDHETDVVCVGSGAGGMSAALTASIEGLQTLIVEKTSVVGGSTAVSGGAVWIPNNSQSSGLGHEDSIQKAKLYLDRIVCDWTSDEMKLAFLEAGPAMLEYRIPPARGRWHPKVTRGTVFAWGKPPVARLGEKMSRTRSSLRFRF